MPQITSRQLIAAIATTPGIQSATWSRRTDKWEKRCPRCDGNQIARHEKQDHCNDCHADVTASRVKVASEGDEVTLQFHRKINPNGTKNWTPAGGQCFGVATKAEADEIKRKKGLIGVLKMSETGTGDIRAMPRVIPVFDVERYKAEGIEYEVVN